MAAYAALVSIMQIFDLIEHHPSPPISLDKEQVESLTGIIAFLQEFLEGYKSPFGDGDEADPLEMRIADAVYAAEDAIESHIVDQILPAVSKNGIGFFNCFQGLHEPKSYGPKITSAVLHESLTKVIKDLNLIKKEVMEMVTVKDQLQRQVYATAGSSMLRNNSSSSSLSGHYNTIMVGFDDVMLQLMDKLTDGQLGLRVIPILGMGGIGKTTLARNIYEKPFITRHFDICAWVTITQQFNTRELLCEILSQANKEGKEKLSKMREDEVGLSLHKCLSYRRYFIVLDDMWSVEAWEELQLYFPDNSKASRIMVTTRLSNLRSHLDNYHGLEMKFMDEGSSWDLLCKTVFGGKSCPLELEKTGMKIVESCRGLPLSIVVMGGVLRKLEPTKECWESIRGSINSLVNSENDNHCLRVLKLSYNHLPVQLKSCYLHMGGTYEEDSEIRVSRVIKLWVSEGFVKPTRGKSLETIAKEYLDELADRNLILVHKLGSIGNMKYCKIHDLLRDLCLREAEKERFYHVVGKHSPQGMYSQRRVVIPKNTSKKKVLYAIGTTPHVRSYISDHERFRLLPDLRLLRILKAYDKGRFGKHKYSPRKLLELVNLRLLVIQTREEPLPHSSIKFPWCLQTLIVSNLKKDINAPVEIWNMPQLRHVQFWRGALHLPDLTSDNIVIMENLQTLKGVKNFKCDEMMVRKIPNIKKLGLAYYREKGVDPCEDYCVHNIKSLRTLESLSFECIPYPGGNFLRKLTFPSSLKKLTLQVIKGRMEDIMEKVSTLPLLQKLELSHGDFTTGKWETVEGQFPSLKHLSLQCCSQLECWMIESSSHFPCLEHLHLYALKDLEEIPAEIGEIPTLKSVVLEYCTESAVKSAKRMVEEQEDLQGEEELSFTVSVTLSEENEELQSLANPNFQVSARKWYPLIIDLSLKMGCCLCCPCCWQCPCVHP